MQDVLKPRVDESTRSSRARVVVVVVVVVAVVLFVPFLAGSCSVRYVSCDEAGAGETDISDMAVRGPTPDIVRLLG